MTKKVGYVDTPIPKQCGTCKYLQMGRICSQSEVKEDKEVPHDNKGNAIVSADNGCCNEWTPREEKPLGARFATARNSLNP